MTVPLVGDDETTGTDATAAPAAAPAAAPVPAPRRVGGLAGLLR